MLVLSNAYVVCFRFDSRYGEIANINLVRDKKTGKTKGFAFICYEDQRSTVLAVDNFNATKVRFSRFIALISPNFGMSSPYVSWWHASVRTLVGRKFSLTFSSLLQSVSRDNYFIEVRTKVLQSHLVAERFIFRNRRYWSSLHGLGRIGAISQVTLD